MRAEVTALDPHGSAIVAFNVLAFCRGRFVRASDVTRALPDSWLEVVLRVRSAALAGRNDVALSILEETPEGEGGYAHVMVNLIRAAIDRLLAQIE